MKYNYKDLTYIRAALQSYEAEHCSSSPDEFNQDEYSEIQDDIPYVSRLIALTKLHIQEFESLSPSLNSVTDPE